jgi:acetate---CoA ligase (ADP-forming)
VEALDKARSNNKTILAIRAGRSELARQNLIAHTGKLISSSTALDSLLKQKGVILLNNYDELLETALLFSALGSPKKELKQAIGLITNSGGDATFLADLCERLHIPLPKLSPEIRTQIANKLQKSTLIGNPLDITDFHPGFYESMDAFLGEPSFDIAGCRLILPNKPNEELKEEYSRVNSLAKSHGKIMVFLSRATEYFDKEWFDFFSSINAPFVLEYEKALKALSLYLDASKKTAVVEPVQSYPRFLTPSLENLVSESPAGVLSFETSQELASAYQIPVPQSKVAADSKGAAQIASQIGCPVALKVVSSQFVHKTEAGVVALGIKTPSEAELVVERIISEAKRSNPAATIDGVLVQRMVEGGVAEVIIGTSRDPQLGSIIVFGLGGIFVEVLRDVATRVAPISLDDARQMIEELKGKQILMGFRGKPLADLNALAETIWKVSRLALDLNTISEFEINPLVVLPKGKGVSAIDIRAVKSST